MEARVRNLKCIPSGIIYVFAFEYLQIIFLEMGKLVLSSIQWIRCISACNNDLVTAREKSQLSKPCPSGKASCLPKAHGRHGQLITNFLQEKVPSKSGVGTRFP